MKRALGTHEFRVSYCASSGHFQWWSSDGRKGSDPMRAGMNDGQAFAIARSIHRRLAAGQDLFFQIEDE